MFTNHIFDIYEKQDLALNNQRWLICHKTQSKENHIPGVVIQPIKC